MTPKDADIEELKRRQLAQERAAREALEQADSRAEAETQQRRAEKARYIREKLQERERADREAADSKD
jgi:hypothetical protein